MSEKKEELELETTKKNANNEIDIESEKLGLIRFPRLQAQADITIKKRKIKKSDGTITWKKITTINDEKIADTCIQLFQQSKLSKEFDYKIMRERAEKRLEPRFKKYKLYAQDFHTKKEVNEIEKKREIAIAQEIREYIETEVDTTYVADYNKFIKMTGIKTAERIGTALKILKDVQVKSFYEFKVLTISEDFSEISHNLKVVSAIPNITLLLDDELGSKFNTFTDFVESDIKNKKKHIRAISFDINKSYLSSVLGLGNDYTSVSRQSRDNFSSSYSFRLHTLLKSIEKVQHIEAFNKFDFASIQRKFGTQFKDYRNFKMRVLVPAMKDINEHTDLIVELLETRESSQISFIKFKISKKISYDRKTKYGIDATAYYIASRLFYFSNQKINDLLAFGKYIEKSFDSLDLVVYDGKYLNEWKEEAKDAIEMELEIIDFMENQKKIMKEKGLVYDEKRMCIIEKVTVNASNDEGVSIVKERKKIITTAEHKITNPQRSLEYLYEVCKEADTTVSIVDYLPFTIATTGGWVTVDIKDYPKYEERIKYLVFQKEVESIVFDDDNKFADIFYANVMRENFKEITNEFKKMVKSLARKKEKDPLGNSTFDDFDDFIDKDV